MTQTTVSPAGDVNGARARRLPPGPRGGLFSGVLAEFRRNPLAMLTRLHRQYGDVVRLHLGTRSTYIVSHPDYFRHILQENNRNYRKNKRVIDILRLAGGENLFTSEGEFWLRERRLMQPAFHRQRIAAFGEIMTGEAQGMIERWQAAAAHQQPLRIDQEMMRITLTIVGRALFSRDLGADASTFGPAFGTTSQYLNYRLSRVAAPPLFLPTARNRTFRRARRTVDDYAAGLIAERRREGGDRGDLLDMLLHARDEETGAVMSDTDVLRETTMMIFAGHETTAVTLTWTWYLLSQHPEVERKLHAELDRVLGGRAPAMADLSQLRYTRMVIDEALRLYPPAWALPRQSLGPDRLGEYDIPADTPFMLSPWIVHRDPRFWERPERFEPERFEPERSEGRPHFAYVPFGGGPRQCIGNTFALTEAQLVLATLAQHYRLRLVPGHVVEPMPIFVLRPRYGLAMTVEARV